MSGFAIVFTIICCLLILGLPRRYAAVPLFVGCCYMTIGQGVHIFGLSFPVYRLLLATALIRMLAKGEGLSGGVNAVDKLIVFLATWVILASCFHENIPGAGPVYTAGLLFNITLSYFITRAFCRDASDAAFLVKVVALLLVPVAAEMMLEKATGRNLFAIFGGVPEVVGIRDGKLRAQGPFLHPILAGTVGAVCTPLMLGIRRTNPSAAIVGIVACLVIVYASASSGPIMSLGAGLFAIALWPKRKYVRVLLWSALCFYLLLNVAMKQPAYYLLARIDLSGGSTGWHRAYLIDQSIQHLSEWWLFGTDYTKHWIPYGIVIGGRHADITNYYLGFGILGGLVAMSAYIAILCQSFRMVLKSTAETLVSKSAFLIWCFGSSLFAHAVTGVSVAYFDQSVFFLWMALGIISSIASAEPSFNAGLDEPNASASEVWECEKSESSVHRGVL